MAFKLFLNRQKKYPVKGFKEPSRATLPSFPANDLFTVEIHQLDETGDRNTPFTYYTPVGTNKLAMGDINLTPQAGQFTFTYVQTTAAVAWQPTASTLQSALNDAGMTSIAAAGGVIVSGSGAGPYYVTFGNNGARTLLTGDATTLSPDSQIFVVRSVAGTASVKEVQIIYFFQKPAAFQDTWNSLPVAAVNVQSIQTGSATQNAIQRVSINQDAYEGSFTIASIDFSKTSGAIIIGATEDQFQTACDNGFGAGTVLVTRINNWTWDVEYIGTWGLVATSNFNTVAAFSVPVGLSAILDLSKAPMLSLLGTDTSIDTLFEFETTYNGEVNTYLHETVQVIRDLINNQSSGPSNQSVAYTTTEADNGFIQNQSAVTGYTGGGSTKIDGLTTSTRAVGQMISATIDSKFHTYKLISSTAATASPRFIRGTDYLAVTNEKVWQLIGISETLGDLAFEEEDSVSLASGIDFKDITVSAKSDTSKVVPDYLFIRNDTDSATLSISHYKVTSSTTIRVYFTAATTTANYVLFYKFRVKQ